MQRKKLIEVALPLEKINAESAREKSIRHGHPSTLHLWWARRPLATARAVIWASLVDDPSSDPERFPTEEEQNKERQRLFRILEELVVWENSDNERVLNAARAEILRCTNGEPPALLDPFAGGGAIPLEAQRLGLEAHAHDLNPVAVMINKAMIEIPPRFAGLAAVNPDERLLGGAEWKGAAGLAADVKYYGEWVKQEAFRRIGHLYPKVRVPEEHGGGEATVIAWIWARTVKCPNPACGCEMPLASSFVLSKKKGHEAWIEPAVSENKVSYHVKNGKCPKDKETIKQSKGAAFSCVCCGTTTDKKYIHDQFESKKSGAALMAIVAEGEKGRLYISPNDEHALLALSAVPTWFPPEEMNTKCTDLVSGRGYGITKWSELFTNRQLTSLTTFSDLVAEAQQKAEKDAVFAGMDNDNIPLSENGRGAKAYGEAVGVYLAFVIDKLTTFHSSCCGWNPPRDGMKNIFGRQAIPMVWDYAEANPFSNSSGCMGNMLDWVYESIMNFPVGITGKAIQFDAQSDCGIRNIMVSTDPPYYDNIGYADLSDFFYIWMRKMLHNTYPKLFRTMLVPKTEELVATPYRFAGNVKKARDFFEKGMFNTCEQIYQYSREDVPVTIYYAYKQSESENETTASTGWETMLTAIIKAGFSITGTWPVNTERTGRPIGNGTNALSSSIVLVCRKRPQNAMQTTRRSFINELHRELRPALQNLQRSNIAPVDLAQSAIGPGMGVYSRYSAVLEADGTPMTVRSALQIINQEIDSYFNEQDSELDRESRFCIDLYTQSAFNDIRFGDADTLARAKNTSVDALVSAGVVYAQKGVVHLITRDETAAAEKSEKLLWLLTQQLTYAMETGGIVACAMLIKDIFGNAPDRAKDLAYRLFTIADRKGWAQEAYAYNTLVTSWQEIQSAAASLRAAGPDQIRMTEFV